MIAAVVVAALLTSTERVADLFVYENAVHVATEGGIERYQLPSLRRTRVYTVLDGLEANAVRKLSVDTGALVAWTSRARCVLSDDRFACTPAEAPPPELRVARTYQGARETVRIEIAGKSLVGTAGAGLWIDGAEPRKLTPPGGPCTNHVEALAEYRGRTYLGGFDDGLCVLEGDSWRRLEVPFRSVNDLLATPWGLYVAAGEGLFVSRDGERFTRERRVLDAGANRLARTDCSVFVTTPGALFRISHCKGVRSHVWRRPAGSTSLQAVSVGPGGVFVATEDRGVLLLRGGRFQTIDRAAGLPSSWVVDVLATPDGGALVATLRHGLARISPAGVPVRIEAIPEPWILRLVADGSAAWVGTQEGAYRLAGSATERISGLPDPCAHAFLRTREAVYVGTEGGLARFETAEAISSRER